MQIRIAFHLSLLSSLFCWKTGFSLSKKIIDPVVKEKDGLATCHQQLRNPMTRRERERSNYYAEERAGPLKRSGGRPFSEG